MCFFCTVHECVFSVQCMSVFFLANVWMCWVCFFGEWSVCVWYVCVWYVCVCFVLHFIFMLGCVCVVCVCVFCSALFGFFWVAGHIIKNCLDLHLSWSDQVSFIAVICLWASSSLYFFHTLYM